MSTSRHGPSAWTRRRRQTSRGSSLFLLLILSVVMATVLAGIFSHISTSAKAEKRSNARLESTYAAEYAFEQAYEQLVALIGQNTVNLPDVEHTSTATNLTKAPTSVFGSAQGYDWKAFVTVPVEDSVPVAAHTSFNPTSGVYKFMTVVEFTRSGGGLPGTVHLQFQREWDYRLTPLFRYAIFYNGDLELFPGAAFKVGGRVHSNGRIYTGTSASIRFTDYVTEVSGVSNHYKKPADPRTESGLNGTITYDKQTPIAGARQNPPGQLTADRGDANYNNDGSRELIEIPNSWQSDPNSTDRMYTKAGLKVLVNTTGSAVTADNGATIPANAKVFLTAEGTVIPTGDPLATYLATLIRNGPSSDAAYRVRDDREDTTLTTTNIDASALATAQDAGGLPQTIPNAATWPNNNTVPAALRGQPIPATLRGRNFWNGVLYVTDVTNSPTHRTAVKLVNGATLPDGGNNSSPARGLTVATANAAYIVGNYNSGGNPPVNSGADLTASNHTASYTVQPAAVIADAVTVLSTSWSDANTASTPLSSRTASNTTVNTALVSGIVQSDGTAYSGGVENYIRLLEDWSGKRLTYYGSMINVYDSEQSTGHWKTTGNYYQAPARNWYFDTNFLNPNKLPPGTPVLRSLARGQWVQIE